MKILHISHHIGCMRDHAYIYHMLGAEYEFWKFPKGVFHITKELAQSFWNLRREYFNRFDYIVTSDTAPLSRIFMENINELKPTVIVWICNRFDYNMERDLSFYQIFNKMAVEHQNKFKIIPYSDFEGIWCKARGIQHFLPTITPIGVNHRKLDAHVDGLQELEASYTKDPNATQMYNSPVELNNKMFIPIYGNDNIFFNLKTIFQENGIDYFNGGYKHPTDLQHCKAVVTFPDAFSKLITFETIQNEIIVFLPSEDFLIKLHPTKNNNTNYWFNCPFGHLDQDLIKFCEWYRYTECRIYFDSIADLIYKIRTLSPETIHEKKAWCRQYGKIIEETNMNLWKQIII
jgi:hypothetical protein